MGGSGGGGSVPSSTEAVQAVKEEALRRLAEQERQQEVNEVLGDALRRFNDRDVDLVRERLDDVQAALGNLAIDVDRLLYGGSVAKHTYVDGLSDVDALVVVDDAGAGPAELVERFREQLDRHLPRSEVAEVSAGRLAVTVRYLDGTEIQLLPSVERAGHTSIAAENGQGWQQIRPHKFAEKLTEVNKANGREVVPTIKLAKAALRSLPDSQQLSGYHVEAIAVDAFRSYDGRRDRASMLVHLVRHAQQAVLKLTGDITGQSVHIDAHLGSAGSDQRRRISEAIGGLATRIERDKPADIGRLLND